MGLGSTPLKQWLAGFCTAAYPHSHSPGLPHALPGHHEHAHGHLGAEQLPTQSVGGSQTGQAQGPAPYTARPEVPEQSQRPSGEDTFWMGKLLGTPSPTSPPVRPEVRLTCMSLGSCPPDLILGLDGHQQHQQSGRCAPPLCGGTSVREGTSRIVCQGQHAGHPCKLPGMVLVRGSGGLGYGRPAAELGEMLLPGLTLRPGGGSGWLPTQRLPVTLCQDLMQYCARDVWATYEVFQQQLPLFLER